MQNKFPNCLSADVAAAAWARAKAIPELLEKSKGMSEDWDSFKMLYTDRNDRLKDFYVIEREFLDRAVTMVAEAIV